MLAAFHTPHSRSGLFPLYEEVVKRYTIGVALENGYRNC